MIIFNNKILIHKYKQTNNLIKKELSIKHFHLKNLIKLM
jgi:hypothetical protein